MTKTTPLLDTARVIYRGDVDTEVYRKLVATGSSESEALNIVEQLVAEGIVIRAVEHPAPVVPPNDQPGNVITFELPAKSGEEGDDPVIDEIFGTESASSETVAPVPDAPVNDAPVQNAGPIVDKTKPLPLAIDIAKKMVSLGAHVITFPRGQKAIKQIGWQNLATRDLATIEQITANDPHCNVGVVGKPDGLWFFDDDQNLLQEYEAAHGKIESYRARSVSGGTHLYLRQNDASREMGNINGTAADGSETWSARVNNRYVVAPGSSAHPDNDPTQPETFYTAVDNVPVIEAPVEFIQFLKLKAAQNPEHAPVGKEPKPGVRIAHGGIHNFMLSQAGRLRSMGLSAEGIEPALLEIVHKFCQPPIDDSKVIQMAHSICNFPAGTPAVPLQISPSSGGPVAASMFEPQVTELVQPSSGPSKNDDMPDSVLDGRLGEICQRRMLKHFPVSYAWPSLIAAAGVKVPSVIPQDVIRLQHQDDMTNSYTGLIGPVHSGKSQSIHWASNIINLPTGYYSDVKAGSSEMLLQKLNRMNFNKQLGTNILIDLDEWAHLFSKAGIENSSFVSFMHTAFYKRHINILLPRGKEAEIDCGVSFIGGVVDDEFDTCFGAKSMGGLYDRFTFGLCPEGYNFIYQPFEGGAEFTTEPCQVEVDQDIWEMVKAIRKADSSVGREAEIAVRVAKICASFDGRKRLQVKDCEASIKAFIGEQVRVRKILQPNAGVTTDAMVANALIGYLKRHAPNQQIVTERQVRQGIRKTLERLGPGCLEYTTKSLARQGVIYFAPIEGGRVYAGRPVYGYQLLNEQAA